MIENEIAWYLALVVCFAGGWMLGENKDKLIAIALLVSAFGIIFLSVTNDKHIQRMDHMQMEINILKNH